MVLLRFFPLLFRSLSMWRTPTTPAFIYSVFKLICCFFLKRLPYSSPARCIIFWSPFSTLLRFRLFVIYHKCHFTDLCSPHSFHRSVCVNTVWKSRPHSQRWINIGIEKANAFTVWWSRCVNWLQIEKKEKNLNEIFTKRFATDSTTDRFNLYLSFISSRPETGEANWCH